MLGGRIAESLVFNTISTGAQDDLERATKLAYDEVTHLGMSKSIGKSSLLDIAQVIFAQLASRKSLVQAASV